MATHARSLFRTIALLLTLASAGCDLMLGLDGKKDPVPLQDGDTIDGVLDVDVDGEGEIEIPPNCGDGDVDEGEECDDGNDVDGDGCDRDCTWSCRGPADCDDSDPCNGSEECEPLRRVCVDGTPLDTGTVCLEDPRSICVQSECRESVCGDHYLDSAAGEECDDGNTSDGDGCSGACLQETGPECGNGTQDCDGDEACDDGNRTAGDGCSPSCRLEPVPTDACGNGTVDPREVCDDGDMQNGDACNPTCNFTNTTALFVGTPGMGGITDGTGSAARLGGSGGFALCGNDLYLADTMNNVIRRIDVMTASIETIAGDAENGQAGSTDALRGLDARFSSPASLTTDGFTLWVGDTGNTRLRAMDLTANDYPVTTVAGSGESGHVDGAGTEAQFDDIRGLTYYAGLVYLLDAAASTLRSFDPDTGEVVTLAGTPYFAGGVDGIGPAARFNSPRHMTSNFSGLLYLSDYNGFKIRIFNVATAAVTTFVGSGMQDYVDGTGDEVRVFRPRGLAFDGSSLYWIEFDSHTVRQGIVYNAVVSTMVGTIDASGYQEAVGTAALLTRPYDIIFHFPTNSLFVLDSSNFVIRRIQ